jgi:SAM-dependent methyltransferase
MLPAAYDATVTEPASWDAVYVSERAPWDIGRPQAAFAELADAGEIGSPVLDSGCGTGEHALMLAGRGLTAMGIDVAPTAIHAARRKAIERGLDVDFEVGDVLALDRLERTFATVIDSGVFHVFDDGDRARYVSSLATVLDPGGVLHLLCFSELTPGDTGPRRVTQAELHAAFAGGWRVDRIDASRFEVRPDYPVLPHAWRARIVRS